MKHRLICVCGHVRTPRGPLQNAPLRLVLSSSALRAQNQSANTKKHPRLHTSPSTLFAQGMSQWPVDPFPPLGGAARGWAQTPSVRHPRRPAVAPPASSWRHRPVRGCILGGVGRKRHTWCAAVVIWYLVSGADLRPRCGDCATWNSRRGPSVPHSVWTLQAWIQAPYLIAHTYVRSKFIFRCNLFTWKQPTELKYSRIQCYFFKVRNSWYQWKFHDLCFSKTATRKLISPLWITHAWF